VRGNNEAPAPSLDVIGDESGLFGGLKMKLLLAILI
jgi:hypothetical protein